MTDSIKIKNIYYMLAYAFQTLHEAGVESVATEDFENIHELLSTILAKGISSQVKRGLHRDYMLQTETLGSLKGKIDMTASVKQQTMTASRMICHYDVFSEDTELNRILKSTMLLLLRYGDMRSEKKKVLRKLLLYFEGVSEINPSLIQWNAIRYERNSAAYRMLINICQLVIKGLLQTTESGDYTLTAFIDDQRMYRLYEKFVLAYYQREFPDLSVSAAHVDWNLTDGDDQKFLPIMKTDIMISFRGKTLIIDTKYYGRTMQMNPQFDKATLISNNLYQIFTYVKNKDRENTGEVSGVLLYAKTDEELTPDYDYCICGNNIGVKTLDLGDDWSEIKAQLDALPSQYLKE